MPHLTKTAPSECGISARPALTYLHFAFVLTLLVYMSKTPLVSILLRCWLICQRLAVVYVSKTPVIFTDVIWG